MTNKGKLARNKVQASTQKYVDIGEIKEDTVVMRDGTMRAVLLVSSINFALKSEEEQNATISSYVSFLNNISFPLQIIIQSRELNIEEYIIRLREKENEQTNELLKMQTADYIAYIQELVDMSRIMNKRFYVVVPYNPLSDKQKGFFARLFDLFRPDSAVKMRDKAFNNRRKELNRRVDNVLGGLTSMGLSAVQLDTQSLIELYYNTYNPITSANEKLVKTEKLRVNKQN
ncbi:hypothetical protein C0584_01440 [Candidatus Parcubacteria bacterium]|nr:MAG: hypothetical protein C0584_01440 [Candidatus Parcubacteria bacterium]